MGRKIYETQADLNKEKNIKKELEKKWSCNLIKLPIRYCLDYVALRNKRVVAFIEIKHRTNKIHAYPTYMLSLAKVQAAKRLAEDVRVPSFLVVQWADVLGATNLATCKFSIEMGGRTDRKDSQDIEPVAHIDLGEFNKYRGER